MIVLKETVSIEDGGCVADGRKLHINAPTTFLSIVVSKGHIGTWAYLYLYIYISYSNIFLNKILFCMTMVTYTRARALLGISSCIFMLGNPIVNVTTVLYLTLPKYGKSLYSE